jgi:hypothetical protein
VRQVVLELRRVDGDVVDDDVHDQVSRATEGGEVLPGAQAGVDLGVVSRIEPGVGAVVRAEERQNVHSAEDAGERSVEKLAKLR